MWNHLDVKSKVVWELIKSEDTCQGLIGSSQEKKWECRFSWLGLLNWKLESFQNERMQSNNGFSIEMCRCIEQSCNLVWQGRMVFSFKKLNTSWKVINRILKMLIDTTGVVLVEYLKYAVVLNLVNRGKNN